MPDRTSLTHPLRIDTIDCSPFAPGTIGITFCPGKCGDSVHGADPWRRDLDLDLDAVQRWGAAMAFTLIEDHEFRMLKVERLGEGFRARGIEWHHLPVRDLDAPGEAFHALWQASGAAALNALREGGKVLVHCRGGLGRAGTVACVLLMELGCDGREALLRVRAARPGAVEMPAQERYLAKYRPRLPRPGN